MMKKVLIIVLSLMMVLAIFNGCSSKESTDGTKDAAGSTTAVAPSSAVAVTKATEVPLNKDAKLTVWSIITPGESEALRAIGRDFTSKEGIAVEVVEVNGFEVKTKFTTEAPTGKGPDIIMAMHSDTGELALMDLIRPLEFLDKKDTDRYMDLAVNSFMYNNKLYGIGYSIESYGLVYNKKLVNEPPKTWDELFAMMESLMVKDSKGNVTTYGFLINPEDFFFTYPLYTGYGGYVFGQDKEGNFNADDIGLDNEGSIKALEKLKSLSDKGLIPKDIAADVIDDFFTKGKLAMMIYGPWFFNKYKENGIDFGYVPVPNHANGTKSQPFGTINGFMCSNHSKNKNEADAFLKFVLEDKNQQKMIEAGEEQRVTLNKSVYNSDYVQKNLVLKQICDVNLTAQASPNIPEGPLMWNIGPSIKLAINGELSVQDAMKEFVKVMRENIAAMKK